MRATLIPLLLLAAMPAQTPAPPPDLAAGAAAILLPFARLAEQNKALPRAKAAYELCLEYDPDNRTARVALGFRRLDNQWQPGPKPKAWLDAASPTQQQTVETAWAAVQKQLGALHRDVGLALLDQDPAAARAQLQRALAHDPTDLQAHRGLGHQQHGDFFGTPEQIAFLQRLAAFEAKVEALRQQTYSVTALADEQLPPELRNTRLPFAGVQTPHFQLWVRGSAATASECGLWAERARDFLILVLGAERTAGLQLEERLKFAFVAFTCSEDEREQFLAANQDTWQGQQLAIIRRFDDFFWDRQGGRGAIVWTMDERLRDRVVGFVVFQGFLQGRNEGLGEGLLHAATWYLLRTTWTWYGSLPSTAAGGERPLLPDPTVWLERLREQIDQRQDWPLAQVPRERLTQYRPQVRIKAWSVMAWMVAAYPQHWLPLFLELSKHEVLMPEDVEAIGRQVFGRPLGEVELEWREFADGRSAVARAAGRGR